MKGWTTGKLKDRNFNKRWPNRNLMTLLGDVIDALKRVEAKTSAETTYPSIKGYTGSSEVGDVLKGILLGDSASDQTMTFYGSYLTFGQGVLALENVAETEFDLYCIGGVLGKDYSVVVAVADGADEDMAVALSGYVLTITLGTDGDELPDDAKNTLTLIKAAMYADEDIRELFAFGLTDGQGAMSMDQAQASTSFTEPTLLYGEAISCLLFGSDVYITNLLEGVMEVTIPNALTDADGAIGSIAENGDTLDGILRLSGLGYVYHMHTTGVPQ